MDFRILVLGLLFLTGSAIANTDRDMDNLVTLIYQYPDKAKQELAALEQQPLSKQQQLRLQVLRCQTLLQLGERRPVINLVQTTQRQARQQQIEQAVAYLQTCEAEAYGDEEDFKNPLRYSILPLKALAIITSHKLWLEH
ncbi:hypothetical protein KHX94_07495 [Shewanella dokdonensis]|uniref:Uncharacterized protein n=1 Tax=Shewanella dokdonensis TaxID=712036 RepID=A0ABX8DHU4_9GAMM|nr:hypothetical protein [Shewanella dokdonensis]QVK24338.1 hypothetical protein KHX94_07495 [Shewanella dokdonensis]